LISSGNFYARRFLITIFINHELSVYPNAAQSIGGNGLRIFRLRRLRLARPIQKFFANNLPSRRI